ncbi:hypothetical protein EIN_340270 [Entamoeba invadens IP1]|uniref:Uncharacterized protein n=1 Tax=Entamoeba invadens IP1 TaxID=370355 RepID=A0A0A1UDN9_ENTIV|nr:hypothetical protein EIN_340270 [Entamoeba invadens IP1]ELP94709.1 hypothetical protein EIN_340270 [Entamoeba invadens IP1]|eukprot:XP_004261480.1 hypothetical protein EIN_340270 [Entamoeba invadens IP1]
MARVSYLAQNTTHCAMFSVSGMSKSFSSFVASISFNHAYIYRRNANRCEKTTGEGMKRVFESFSSERFKGLAGLVFQPGTSEGIGSSANTNKILRIQEPRNVNYKVVMKSYDKNESLLLNLVRNTKLEVYIGSYLSHGTCAWVFGEKHFYYNVNNDIKVFKYPSLEINRTVDGL